MSATTSDPAPDRRDGATSRSTPERPRPMAYDPADTLGLMLGGGGARGAYQAGVLRGIASRFPNLAIPILAGISAGAVNTLHLAAHPGTLREAADDLAKLWLALSPDQVYDVRSGPLLRNVVRWGKQLMSGGVGSGREPLRGLVDTAPLRRYLKRNFERAPDGALPGIAHNLDRGTLKAVALSATSYTTGQSVTWVEGRDIEVWQRSQRHAELTRLTIEHVMASTALPMLFPAVQVGTEWFGDGGIRLTAPLSPAVHLGASRILTISTTPAPPTTDTSTPSTGRYPPPAQVMGVLYDAIFLDLIDEDISRLRRVNQLIEHLRPEDRAQMRKIDILVLRPSCDLSRLATGFEPRLPGVFRYLTRGLGTKRSDNPEFISLILFQADYLNRLIEIGEADALAQSDVIEAFLTRPAASGCEPR